MVMHGASSQWLHRMTEKWRSVFGWVPVSTYLSHVRLTPSGISCSLLQATVQAWQPMQLPESRTKPRRVMAKALVESSERAVGSDGHGRHLPDAGTQQVDQVVEAVVQVEGVGVPVTRLEMGEAVEHAPHGTGGVDTVDVAQPVGG